MKQTQKTISPLFCKTQEKYIKRTGAGEKLLDLLVLRHVLDGSVDLLSDSFYFTLPFQITVTSIQQPVYGHTQLTATLISEDLASFHFMYCREQMVIVLLERK